MKMEPSHLSEAEELEKLCFSAPWSAGMILGELKNPLSHYIAAVGDDDTLIGYAGMQAVLDEGYIANVAVLPEYRRKGVAVSLISALISFSLENGLAFLTLEVRESNLPAISLYEKFGFEKVGRRKNYYRLPTEDAILMTRVFERNEQP